MQTLLYCTADKVGSPTGAGQVTANELLALKGFGDVAVFDREQLGEAVDPFAIDARLHDLLRGRDLLKDTKAAHFYSGTFSKTIAMLQGLGIKVTYTCAAHDIQASREAHEELGMAYDYPHLTDSELWKKYFAGYLAANYLICPSRHSAQVLGGFGRYKDMWIIPHGTNPVATIAPLPKTFRVGYLGAIGPDKGLIYLLMAWKKAALKNATLVLAGAHSTHLFDTARAVGGGNIEFKGYVDSPSDLYNYCSVYCQPSVTEGFGIEIIEALAHGRPVIASTGAGASDAVGNHGLAGTLVKPRNVDDLAAALQRMHSYVEDGVKGLDLMSKQALIYAEKYYWPRVRAGYAICWDTLGLRKNSNATTI